MGFEWTEEQRAVIDTRKRSVLVSAAAGSGKTAVLVERIIRLLTDEKHPVEIDKLLVVTFTNAAAAEMRERIGRGIDKKLQEQPGRQDWQRQKLLLPYAQISTIHSLCLKLIRERFDMLDLDPSFRMGDEAELKLLKADVATDVMEVYYASDNTAFRDFVERYASGKTDQGIAEMIIRIYDYSRGYPWPEYWLEQCCSQYASDKWSESGHPVLVYAVDQMKKMLQKYFLMLEDAERLCLEPDGPDAYLAVVQSDREWMEMLDQFDSYEEIRSALQQIKWKRLPRAAADVREDLKEEVKTIHAEIKADISKLQEDFFAESADEVAAEMEYIRPSVEMLTELVKTFSEKFREEKTDRNMLDFSDLEHYALQLLVDFHKNEDGSMSAVPTSAADELSGFYSEVVCDEYQDSNQVQEMILDVLSGERTGQFNRFMVGDVKQSIYRFRLADAAIFMNKYNSFRPFRENGSQVRIDLHQNFRSRASVLEGINFFFRQMMTQDLGGIDYDDKAALYPGMVYPDAGQRFAGGRTEVMLLAADEEVSDEDDQELSAIQIEAKAIAAKIHELTDAESGMDVYDGDLGEYRRAGYKDIVILLRTVSGWAETFMEVLGQENIPVSAEMSEGFFDTMEIRTMIELLSVIDNPGQDIPLAAVLKSPIAGLSSEEMALIRGNNQEGNLYRACLNCQKEMTGYDKLQIFLNMLKDIREASEYMELHELLQYIYDLTGYYDYVQALPGGQRRRANLDLLVERAVSYSSSSYSGLFNFVRYIEQLKKNEIDFGEAAIPEDGKGRVRIISIHKSKGLEYPIVLLAGMGKKMNFKDAAGSLVVHSDYGIGMDAVNLKTRKKKTSVYKRFISKQVIKDTLAEELRILYVAMTRVKEKLIMTGMLSTSKTDEQLKTWYRVSGSSAEKLPDWILSGAKTYLDWIVPCLMRSDAVELLMNRRFLPFTRRGDDGAELFEVYITDIRQLVGREVRRTVRKRYYKEELMHRDLSEKNAEMTDIAKSLQQDDNWQYAWEEALTIKGKYTVSELKKADAEPEMIEPLLASGNIDDGEINMESEDKIPSFMVDPEEKEQSDETIRPGGAFRGTAYHRVLELLNFGTSPQRKSVRWIREQLQVMAEAKRISPEQQERINPYDISDLVFSDLGKRMGRAEQRNLLKREAQFVMGVPISMVNQEVNSQELVVVQGVIDAYFEEEGQLVLVDYKTDRVSKENGEDILRQRYSRQLDYYQYALETMTGKSVKERLIYSFTLKKAIHG